MGFGGGVTILYRLLETAETNKIRRAPEITAVQSLLVAPVTNRLTRPIDEPAVWSNASVYQITLVDGFQPGELRHKFH
jgi:hypothetical protein